MRVDNSRDRSFGRCTNISIRNQSTMRTRWQRLQQHISSCCRWCCSSPSWPSGPASTELRKRYKEMEASYEGIVTLQPNSRGIDDYFIKGPMLGQGGFGTVCQATPTKRAIKAQPALKEGKGYALKRVKLPLRDAEIEMISKSLLGVSPARMLQFLKVIGGPEATQQHVTRNLLRVLEIPHTMHIAMDLLEGPTLRDWMMENKARVPEPLAADLTTQMLKAVHFLHRVAGALHRDVKPQNFGFTQALRQDEPATLQLFDMGLVYVLPEPILEATAHELYALGLGGTMHWIPPETWAGYSGACSDIWGIGLILHVLLLRQLPFGLQYCEDRDAVYLAVKECGPVQRVSGEASAEALQLVQQLLSKDPSQRPSTAVALQWPWLRTAQASSPPSSPSPLSTSRRRTVAAAAAQRQVQLPAETERWKERSFWHSLMLKSSDFWSKAD